MGEYTKATLASHAPDGEPEWVDGVWRRKCKCGRTFESHQGWQHVPRLFDHIAIETGKP